MGYYATQQFTNLMLQPVIDPGGAKQLMASFKASQNIPRGTILSQVTATGLYQAWNHGQSDGSETPKAIAMYDMQTDASGNITLSATASQAGGPWGETQLQAPVWVDGKFAFSELTLSSSLANLISDQPAWHMIDSYAGTTSGGILEI